MTTISNSIDKGFNRAFELYGEAPTRLRINLYDYYDVVVDLTTNPLIGGISYASFDVFTFSYRGMHVEKCAGLKGSIVFFTESGHSLNWHLGGRPEKILKYRDLLPLTV